MLTLELLWILFICSTQSQFKDHLDLQKITEIDFKNERYNVLKPTIHVVEDHFKAFIEKRHNNLEPKHIYLDKNGFRHMWRGLEVSSSKNLRKTALINIKAVNITAVNVTGNGTKDQPRRKKRIEEEYIPPKASLRNGTMSVRTTFYCPFFGVIRMTTHVDNDEEIKEFV